LFLSGNNLALQEELYQLRYLTQEAFNGAKTLGARWSELEKEQRDVHQVCHSIISVQSIVKNMIL
jgi:ESCRT-I complex subunit VPS37